MEHPRRRFSFVSRKDGRVTTADDEPSEGDAMPLGDETTDATASVAGLLRSWAPQLIFAVLVALAVRFLIFQPYEIPSDSMLPTLEPGDRVVVNRLSYTAGDLERGQVIVFDRPPSLAGTDDMIKRVVGLPGETVQFRNDAVYIGSLRMVEPYLRQDQATSAPTGIPGCEGSNIGALTCVVPQGHVFVMGDNRSSSVDSRRFGPIPIDTVIGRAAVRVWPMSSINQL